MDTLLDFQNGRYTGHKQHHAPHALCAPRNSRTEHPRHSCRRGRTHREAHRSRASAASGQPAPRAPRRRSRRPATLPARLSALRTPVLAPACTIAPAVAPTPALCRGLHLRRSPRRRRTRRTLSSHGVLLRPVHPPHHLLPLTARLLHLRTPPAPLRLALCGPAAVAASADRARPSRAAARRAWSRSAKAGPPACASTPRANRDHATAARPASVGKTKTRPPGCRANFCNGRNVLLES